MVARCHLGNHPSIRGVQRDLRKEARVEQIVASPQDRHSRLVAGGLYGEEDGIPRSGDKLTHLGAFPPAGVSVLRWR